jgi:hypothetical protein
MGENREMFLRCECHGYHFVEIYVDPEWNDTVFITHIEQPRVFSEKLKAIWNIIRGRYIFDSELLVKNEDIERLAQYLHKAAKELKNADKKTNRA